jgi:exopolysaccharide production protein ExoZ
VFAGALIARRSLRARLVAGALLAIVVAGFFFPDSAYYMGANPMLLQFAAGVGLGVAAQTGRLPSRAWGAGLLTAAVLVWVLVQAGGLFTELWRPLVWGVPAVLAVAGALSLELQGRPLRPPARWVRPALVLGDASYAIYLFHLPATAVVAHTLGYADPWLFLPVSLAVSVAAGLAVRAWIEKPLLRATRTLPALALRGRRPAPWKKRSPRSSQRR